MNWAHAWVTTYEGERVGYFLPITFEDEPTFGHMLPARRAIIHVPPNLRYADDVCKLEIQYGRVIYTVQVGIPEFRIPLHPDRTDVVDYPYNTTR